MANRLAERVNFFSGGELIQGERSEPISVVDISLNGVLMAPPNSAAAIDWQVGDVGGISVRLNDTGLEMHFSGRVARIDDGLVAMKFEDMDLDTATHLRRLIELNTGKPALVERAVDELGGWANARVDE